MIGRRNGARPIAGQRGFGVARKIFWGVVFGLIALAAGQWVVMRHSAPVVAAPATAAAGPCAIMLGEFHALALDAARAERSGPLSRRGEAALRREGAGKRYLAADCRMGLLLVAMQSARDIASDDVDASGGARR